MCSRLRRAIPFTVTTWQNVSFPTLGARIGGVRGVKLRAAHDFADRHPSGQPVPLHSGIAAM